MASTTLAAASASWIVAPTGVPVGDRLDQPAGLDDLEVVEADRVVGAGLERAELTVAGAGVLRGVEAVQVVLVSADAQLVHAAEVPRDGALGAVHLDAVRVLLADRRTARLENAA